MSSSEIQIVDIEGDHKIDYHRWCVEWWRWLLSIPKPNNPTMDETGKFAYINQSSNEVFFLCQTMEAWKKFPTRKILIPSNKLIFLPIINWISYEQKSKINVDQMTHEAKNAMDRVGKLTFTVNHKSISVNLMKYRVTTPKFEMHLPHNNIFDIPEGPISIISDGFWICFRPLAKEIVMSSYGSCSLGITEIGVQYHLVLD